MAEYSPDNKGPAVVVVCTLFQAQATLFAYGRVFCRIRMLDRLYPDDWIIMLSLGCGWTAVALTIVSVHYSDGRHINELIAYEKSQTLL